MDHYPNDPTQTPSQEQPPKVNGMLSISEPTRPTRRKSADKGSEKSRAPIASLECMDDFTPLSQENVTAGTGSRDFLAPPIYHPLLSRQSSVTPGLRYKNLGKSGLRISNIGLATWATFGGAVAEDLADEILGIAYEAGINVFDTSEIYSGGKAEVQLGKILKKRNWRRSSYVVISKIYWGRTQSLVGGISPRDPSGGSSPQHVPLSRHETESRGLSRKHIIETIQGSLQRLQLDYVDIVIVHKADAMCPMEEIVRAMNHCINQGWALYWGTSRWTPVEIMEAYTNCRQFNCITPIVEQCEYHMFCREKTELYLPEMYNKIGVGTMTWSPLGVGLISPKMEEGQPPAFTRASFRKKYSSMTWPEEDPSCTREVRHIEQGFPMLKDKPAPEDLKKHQYKLRELNNMAEKLGCNFTQLSLAFCLKNDNIQSVLIGAASVDQLYDNIQSLQVLPKVNSAIMNEIENILSNKPVRPPMISTLQQR